jgi:ribosome assembly protein 4
MAQNEVPKKGLAQTYNRGSTYNMSGFEESTAPAAQGSNSITWGGSLVGSTNPNQQIGYKRGRDLSSTEPSSSEPSSIVVQFSPVNADGSASSAPSLPPIDVPIGTTLQQLEALVNSLVGGEAAAEGKAGYTPYAFYLSVGGGADDEKAQKKKQQQQEQDLAAGTSDSATSPNEDLEVTSTLLAALRTANSRGSVVVSLESTISVTYQPLAVFKVRPVTRCTDTLPGHTDAVLFVAYGPDGKNLASAGGDTTVRFWDVNTGLPKHTGKLHRDHVMCVAWSPDGKRLASGDKKGVIIVWDPKTGQPVGVPIKAHSKWITALCWEPMHRNKSCERLLSSSKDNLAKVWNVRTGRCEATLAGHTDSVEACRWGGEGLVYTASRDRSIKVWGAEKSDASGGGGGAVGTLVKTLVGHGHRVNTLALSCDYVCRTGPFDHECKPFADEDAAFAKASERYATVRALGPERLVSGSDDFTLFYWHPVESKHPVKRLTGHQQAVNHIAFSPDARFFASASFDKKVKVWDGRNGNFVNTLTGHVGAVYCVAWSSDSRYLVTASKDSTVKLWEAATANRAKETLPGHEDEVYALDWSPNGSSVATGSKDRTIKIWKH